jgi:hypothetical protein
MIDWDDRVRPRRTRSPHGRASLIFGTLTVVLACVTYALMFSGMTQVGLVLGVFVLTQGGAYAFSRTFDQDFARRSQRASRVRFDRTGTDLPVRSKARGDAMAYIDTLPTAALAALVVEHRQAAATEKARRVDDAWAAYFSHAVSPIATLDPASWEARRKELAAELTALGEHPASTRQGLRAADHVYHSVSAADIEALRNKLRGRRRG